MKRMISCGLTLWLLFAALLPFAPRAAAAEETTRVVCVGDSITYIGGFLKELRTMLDVNGLHSAEVQNFGSDGATAMLYGRYYNGNSCGYANPAYQHYANYPASLSAAPDIVFIMLGTNDSRDCNWNEQREQGFVAGYTELIRAYQSLPKRTKIFLVKPPTMYDSNMGLAGFSEASLRDNILPLIEQIAAEQQLPLLDAHAATQSMAASFRDGVHPVAGSAACKAIANVYYRALTGVLNRTESVSSESPSTSSAQAASKPATASSVAEKPAKQPVTGKPLTGKPSASGTETASSAPPQSTKQPEESLASAASQTSSAQEASSALPPSEAQAQQSSGAASSAAQPSSGQPSSGQLSSAQPDLGKNTQRTALSWAAVGGGIALLAAAVAVLLRFRLKNK